MSPSSDERRRVKKRGIALASSGLFLALVAGLVLRAVGVTSASYRQWLVALAITATVQGALWLVPHVGLDDRLSWDPHYIYLPMGAAAGLLSFYGYLLPEARVLVLMVWVVALLFMAGLAGFRSVVALSCVMAAGYGLGVTLHLRRGLPLSRGFETTVVACFLVIILYAGVVSERLRSDREEMRALRQRLAELALTDPLTGLPNRRQFEDTLRAELARVDRHGGRCSVVMVDVDYFKSYNDRFGHPAGDEILRELARVIRAYLRSSDVASRYGGEEFALVMVNTGKAEGMQVIERLRAIVEDHPFDGREVQPGGRLTISAGIATCPDDGSDYEALVRRSDEALYAAKRGGRNRVHAAA